MLNRFILIAILLSSLFSCNTAIFKDDLSEILGIEKVEIENIEVISECCGLQGDGYFLEIYELSEKTIDAFKNRAQKTLPNRKEQNENWQKNNWSKMPIDSAYNEIFDVCFNFLANDKKLKHQIDDLNELINHGNVYYSFYYKPNKESPQKVIFFLLDIQGHKLYVIDQKV